VTQETLKDYFAQFAGRPVLAIGGGPSVNVDLPRLARAGFRPACVIGANEHATKQFYYSVNFLVNCDKNHCMLKGPDNTAVPMEAYLRPFAREAGAKIMNRFPWADVLLNAWHFNGNSGQTAIAVAAALGGNPVVVTGLDCWGSGRRYFYDTPAQAEQRRLTQDKDPPRAEAIRRFRNLLRWCHGANVRPVSGPLCDVFPRWDPAEQLPPPEPITYRQLHSGVARPLHRRRTWVK
jgi:hypothetical protein